MNEARDYLREAGLTEGQIGNLEAMGCRNAYERKEQA